MWIELLSALALVLVLEGMLPFLNPGGFRQSLVLMSGLDNRSLRIAGFVSMVAGVILLYFIR